ncbi:DPP IV N-terminal domain-containing protein [Mariniblastus fucicola]|uniref:Prolyl tripeptidyl peptidase n=1 Tax=Mariniblastus fucicola TaxID=980251 RepID=A0A5B9P3X4_9BACT|nr:DPP IV N-terminal domain-containing protein [Mariniblastus fucicola]QEG20914.1 Prolyl tripeptidyl peptidase precursor [Mariniblastus fucicola]
MRFIGLLFSTWLLIFTASVYGQSSPELVWIEDGQQFLYESDGQRFLVDVNSRTKKSIDDAQQLAAIESNARLSLPPMSSQNGGESTSIKVKNQTQQTLTMFWVDAKRGERSYGDVKPGETFSQQTYVGHTWLLKANGKRLGSFRSRKNESLVVDVEMLKNVRRKKKRRNRIRSVRTRTGAPTVKPPIEVRDHNLWLQGNQLTEDATESLTFQNVGRGTHWFKSPRGPDVRWSPDAKYLVAFQTANPEEPRVHFVESTPSDQLQPKLDSYQYAKPGDELPTKTLRLFSVENKKEIPVSNELFENPWIIRFVKWTDDGEKFWLHYNQRGHQVVRLVEVDASTGKVRTLIEEKSDTFIQYSNAAKSVFEELDDQQILWASERSGWNHLYRFDGKSGKLLNPVTSGNWNVKRIEWIDRTNEVVWFYAVGVHEDQDPYHEHFCKASFDGSQFTILTDGDGTHKVEFENEDRFLVDTYSRVDMAPVTELRDANSGELIVELDRQDTTAAFGDRPLTTRFSAKGRDGKTDIWGIIHWPRDFDSEKSYPVVENIYAGPHSHHVPKSFRKNFQRQYQFADSGMIVVQIDGMGTAWRSKKFHDVCFKNLKDGGFPDRIAWMKAAAEKYPQMDLSRVGIYGGSAGGQNAMAALLWHNDFYKVAAADCGCHDNRMDKIWWNEQWMGWPVDESYAANSNMENAHLLKGHLILTVGEMDRNVDPATTTQVVKKLIEHDKDFEFLLIPGRGHGAGDSPWAAKKRLNFFKQHLLSDG